MLLPALLLPAAAAVLLALAFWPVPPALRRFQMFAAAGFGLGLSSCAFFLWYPFVGHARNGYVTAEVVVCLALIGVAVGKLVRTPPSPMPSPANPPWVKWMWLAFGVSAMACAAYLVRYMAQEPHGSWDAFSIWNIRARFLFRGVIWGDSFHFVLLHADYPLLVTATVARAWCYAGADSTAAPIALAVLMLVMLTGALVTGLNYLRGNGQGWLAGAVLLATFPVVETAAVQYADIPLAFFFLVTVVLLAVSDQTEGGSRWACGAAGLAAGLAAWTKNEGQLFVAALVLCRVIARWRHLRTEMIPFALGMLPVALTLVIFKFGVAPPNDLVSGQGGDTLSRVTDIGRHARVWAGFAQQVWWYSPVVGAVVAFALLMGRPPAAERPRGGWLPWLVIGATAAGYYLVYLTTPHDMVWHINTSMRRLMVQVWPLVLFAVFLNAAALKGPAPLVAPVVVPVPVVAGFRADSESV